MLSRTAEPRRLFALFAAGVALVACGWAAGLRAEPLADFDPSGLVRFQTADEADARRQMLIRYIWPDGLPTVRVPRIERNVRDEAAARHLKGIIRPAEVRVDRLTAQVAPYDYAATVYLLRPLEQPSASLRLAVVHSGHRREGPIGEGVDTSVERLLAAGFWVMVCDMPFVGWNRDQQLRLPDDTGELIIEARGTAGHNELFRRMAENNVRDGEAYRVFLEPVVQAINYFRSQDPEGEVAMVGLSGGGWATHMAAAVDARIKFSFPVAGAYPLYARKLAPGSWGDAEQHHPPLYGERDQDGDGLTETATGVASWLEVFALGGYGPGRLQVQVLNFHDPCCFSTDVYRSYETFVAGRVSQLGAGRWSLHSDRTHRSHVISSDVLDRVIMPALTSSR